MKLCLGILVLAFCSIRLSAQLSDFQAIDFRRADSIARVYSKHSLSDLKDLGEKLTTSLSRDEEKFRAIYFWVSNNIENDYELAQESKFKREKFSNNPVELKAWEKEFSVRVFKKLVAEQSTVCTGYAYLIRELATRAGLTCVSIDGYGRTVLANIGGIGIPNHSWNAVRLNHKWYLCDATWSSGSISVAKETFIKKYNNAYFLGAPELFVRNHYPLDTTWLLLRDKPTLEEFLNRPIVYNIVYQKKITPVFPTTFEVAVAKGETLTFRFKKNIDTAFNKVEFEINGFTSIPYTYLDPDDLYCLDHKFSSRGTYLVHVLFDKEYAFTYSVKVK